MSTGVCLPWNIHSFFNSSSHCPQKTALPIHFRIVHEFFEPNVVNNPDSLNAILLQKINPLAELQKSIDRLSSISKESQRLTILQNQLDEYRNLYRSLGSTWLVD